MSTEEWIEYFQDANVAIDEKAERVKSLILRQHDLGINIGFLLLNMTDKKENKSLVSEKIA
jgi:hypothetical protein